MSDRGRAGGSRTAPRRRRGRRRTALVLLLLLIGGGGFGGYLWTREEAGDAPDRAASTPTGVVGDVDTAAQAHPQPAASSEDDPVQLARQDHVRGLLAHLADLVRDGDLVHAWRSLSELERAPAADAAACAEGRRLVEQASRQRAAELAGRVEAGEVLAVVAEIAGWGAAGEVPPGLASSLRGELTARAWPDPLAAALPAVEVPPPAPLAGRSRVRYLAADGTAGVGEVLGAADGDPDHVTLRVATASGVLHPRLPRARVEPVAAAGEQALAQLVAALRAGDRVAAALWFGHCRSRGLHPERAVPRAAAMLAAPPPDER